MGVQPWAQGVPDSALWGLPGPAPSSLTWAASPDHPSGPQRELGSYCAHTPAHLLVTSSGCPWVWSGMFSLCLVPWAILHMCVYMLICLSHVQFFLTPWAVALQAPLSMGFSRQEYWNGLPFPSTGDLPDSGIEPTLLSIESVENKLP